MRGSDEQEHPSIPGYFIIEEIGRGGMGIVYLAADLTLHRQVALKMIHRSSQLSADHRRRFVGEARAVARLHHPNLVQIFDAGEHEGLPFLVFELVSGGTLADKIRYQQFEVSEATQLVETLSLALQFAHERHIIHRDLKPSNILLGNDGVARISDFGLAKRLDDDAQQTASGLVVGTPAYMAPEQASGLAEASSPAIDIYSLGAVLYELLTGRPPFKATSVMETLEQLRTTDPIPPRQIRADIPRDLETICLKCLQKEPSRRYSTAGLLAEEIGRFRRGESIMARPTSALERFGRWCRRHPLPTSLAAALMIVFVAAFMIVAWQWKRAVAQGNLARLNAVKFQAERDRAITATALAESNAAQAEEQRTIAIKHQSAAERRFNKAQAPIQELIRLGTELVRQPQMEARGRQALEKASEFRRALMEEKIDDPEVKLATISTLQTLAWTLVELGQFEDAEDTYLQTLDLLQAIDGKVSDSAAYLRHRRLVSLQLSIALLRQKKYEAAEQFSRESVGYSERLVEEKPESRSDLDALGNVLVNYAVILPNVGRKAEAMSVLERAAEIHRSTIQVRPLTAGAQTNLALVLNDLAALMKEKDYAAAESLAVEALQMRRMEVALAKAPRSEVMYLIRSLLQLASWYSDSERIADAEKLLTEAIVQGQVVRNSFPGFFGTRQLYVEAIAAARLLAKKQQNVERADELFEDLKREVTAALVDFPSDPGFKKRDAFNRYESAMQLAQNGEAAQAIEILVGSLRDLLALQRQSPNKELDRRDILGVGLATLSVGQRFEFEQKKQDAVRVWVDQDPENPSALNALAWLLTCVRDTSLRDLDSAEESVRRAIQLKANQPMYHNTLGVVLYYQDRLDEAAVEFEESLNMKTSQPAADWYFLAMIHARRGEIEIAEKLLGQAVNWHREHRPDDAELGQFQDEAYALLGRQPAAGNPP